MEKSYTKEFHIDASQVDCFDRLKLSQVLHLLQETAGAHSDLLDAGREALQEKNLFWAVIRHRVSICRLPASRETITVKTWPMPTTRTAYPRAAEAYDQEGNLLFRSVSLWVLMDCESRAMVLPKKSGVTVDGCLMGTEPESPTSLLPVEPERWEARRVQFTELDINGHMNNCRYLDWVMDLLPQPQREKTCREFTVCYLSEARLGQDILLGWQQQEDGAIWVEAQRKSEEMSAGHSRVFAAQLRL